MEKSAWKITGFEDMKMVIEFLSSISVGMSDVSPFMRTVDEVSEYVEKLGMEIDSKLYFNADSLVCKDDISDYITAAGSLICFVENRKAYDEVYCEIRCNVLFANICRYLSVVANEREQSLRLVCIALGLLTSINDSVRPIVFPNSDIFLSVMDDYSMLISSIIDKYSGLYDKENTFWVGFIFSSYNEGVMRSVYNIKSSNVGVMFLSDGDDAWDDGAQLRYYVEKWKEIDSLIEDGTIGNVYYCFDKEKLKGECTLALHSLLWCLDTDVDRFNLLQILKMVSCCEDSKLHDYYVELIDGITGNLSVLDDFGSRTDFVEMAKEIVMGGRNISYNNEIFRLSMAASLISEIAGTDEIIFQLRALAEEIYEDSVDIDEQDEQNDDIDDNYIEESEPHSDYNYVVDIINKANDCFSFWKGILELLDKDVLRFVPLIRDFMSELDGESIDELTPDGPVLNAVVAKVFVPDVDVDACVDLIYPYRNLISSGNKEKIYDNFIDYVGKDSSDKFAEMFS